MRGEEKTSVGTKFILTFSLVGLKDYNKEAKGQQGTGLSTLNTNTDRRFFVFNWLPMYEFYVFCHGQFLSRPLFTQATLRPLAFMYPDNMFL